LIEKSISNRLLGMTARWAAAVRAAESSREDRLFNDPWAAALAGKEGEGWLAGRPADSTLTMTLRTRYFDNFLLRVWSRRNKPDRTDGCWFRYAGLPA
jgi:O-methyltransferase involved in polyketide biosynthesis